MEKLQIIFSILTHDFDFMLFFWGLVTLPIGSWHLLYFRNKKSLTEKELVNISPVYETINIQYMFSAFVWVGIMFALIFSSLDTWSMRNYGIRFYPLIIIFTAGYGVWQGLFAIIKGVYPMAKSLSYILEDTSLIRRVGMYQVLIAVATIVLVVCFFFLTVV